MLGIDQNMENPNKIYRAHKSIVRSFQKIDLAIKKEKYPEKN